MAEVAPVISNPFDLYRSLTPCNRTMYAAGLPSYPANFTRDSMVAGILLGNTELLETQLEISAHYQGKRADPLTGEKPGKIHHEIPGTARPDRLGFTTYNACDTTALFLMGAEGMSHLDEAKYMSFQTEKRSHLQRAAQHILSTIGESDDLYWEHPPTGSTNYSLHVTYWKDSILPHTDGKLEPIYPVVYAHAHFLAARGLLSAARLLHEPGYAEKADRMYRTGIEEFITPENFTVYRDAESELQQASSDELHSLAYIPPNYHDLLPLQDIKRRAKTLATPFGYICTPADIARHLPDRYHSDRIWVYEQAMIHYGATKFMLHEEATTATAIIPHIGEGQELFSILDEGLEPEGNGHQLWSVAADEYFAGNSFLKYCAWL